MRNYFLVFISLLLIGFVLYDTGSAQWFGRGAFGRKEIKTKCGVYEDITADDDNISLGFLYGPAKITHFACSYIGTGSTVATFTLEDGSGNAMTITDTNPVCTAHGTPPTFKTVTAGNVLTAGEVLRFDTTNTPDPTTDDYTLCVGYQ